MRIKTGWLPSAALKWNPVAYVDRESVPLNSTVVSAGDRGQSGVDQIFRKQNEWKSSNNRTHRPFIGGRRRKPKLAGAKLLMRLVKASKTWMRLQLDRQDRGSFTDVREPGGGRNSSVYSDYRVMDWEEWL